MSQQKLPRKGNPFSTYAKYSGIAFQMIAIIGLGSYGGVKLDEAYPNNNRWFTLICSLASVGIAMYVVFKQVANDSKKRKTDND